MSFAGVSAVAEQRYGDGSWILAFAGDELDRIAFAQAPAVAHEGLPAAQIDPLVQRDPDPRFSAPSFELRRNDLGVVEHQHVARAQQARQVANGEVLEGALPRHDQHPRRIARPRRAQGNAFGRQLEIEEVDSHGGPLPARAAS